jgi:transposase-like protein
MIVTFWQRLRVFCGKLFLFVAEESHEVRHLVAFDGIHDEHVRLLRGGNEQSENHFVADLQKKNKVTRII